MGLQTSELNYGCEYVYYNLDIKSSLTDPSNFGVIFYGLYDTAISGTPFTPLSTPANNLINVVFPVPFSPNMTVIYDELNLPGYTVN